MANSENWKPLYEYKTSWVDGCLCAAVCILLFSFFYCLSTSLLIASKYDDDVYVLIGLLLALGITLLVYYLIFTPSSTVRKRLSKYGVEFFCKKKGLLLVRTSSHKIGLFLKNGNKVISPEYKNIIFSGDYYLLENDRGLWGAYNVKLEKDVVPCDYSSIQVLNNGFIKVEKEGKRYTYSQYGTIIKTVNVDFDDIINIVSRNL